MPTSLGISHEVSLLAGVSAFEPQALQFSQVLALSLAAHWDRVGFWMPEAKCK